MNLLLHQQCWRVNYKQLLFGPKSSDSYTICAPCISPETVIWCMSLFIIKALLMLSCSLFFMLSSCPLSFVVELFIWLETFQPKKNKKRSSNSLSKTYGPISCLSICQTALFQTIKNVPKSITDALSQHRTKYHCLSEGGGGLQRVFAHSDVNEWVRRKVSREHLRDKERQKGSHGWPRSSSRQRVCSTVVLQIVSGSLWRAN